MVKMGRAIEDSSPPEALHELRKQGKELRYLLELFGLPLHPGDVVTLDVEGLGTVRNRVIDPAPSPPIPPEVQIATLRSFRDQVSTLRGGAAALMAMGVLIEHLGEDERAARAEFAERFASFASKAQRALVMETFSS